MQAKTVGPHRLLCGDNLELLPTLADGSVDLISTDPPYGISFMGKAWDKALPDPQTWVECYRVLKPGGSAVVMSGARLDCLWRMCRDLEAAGFELEQTAFFWCYRSGFPKGQDLGKAIDARAGAQREVIGTRVDAFGDAELSETDDGRNLWGKPSTKEAVLYGGPATDLAVALDGWYTKGKVKPAVEVIIWARKPISEKTELANMERHGVGGVNCGACMIPSDEPIPVNVLPEWSGFGELKQPEYVQKQQAGRFPANLLVTGAETCGVDALGEEDSRYFSVSKWAEEHGYSEDWAAVAEAGVLQVCKPAASEKSAGLDGPCKHPTCKPVTLFAYLIEFLTRPGAVVLDPFAGSGTTLCAAAMTGRAGIGMELEPDYFTIMEARVRHWQTQNEPPAIEGDL